MMIWLPFYPPMQAADIFELNIDIAFGGMDQRKAHMYMRELQTEMDDESDLYPYSNVIWPERTRWR